MIDRGPRPTATRTLSKVSVAGAPSPSMDTTRPSSVASTLTSMRGRPSLERWGREVLAGADASPFFRIFNPLTQGRKFDPEARYIRRWIPELAGDEGVDPHEPGLLGPSVGYPEPVVDLPASRGRALDAYASIR